jgi:tetratricopeptide (TPR) repeat protein
MLSIIDTLGQKLSGLWRKSTAAPTVDEPSDTELLLFPLDMPDRDQWRHSEQGDFWLAACTQIRETHYDRTIAFAYFDAHSSQLSLGFTNWLKAWSEVRLGIDQRKDFLASLVRDFHILISEFPRGSRASNLEIAISCNYLGLNIHTQVTNAEKWSERLNDLGNFYEDRILGDRGENIELAIDCYQQTLKVKTRQAFPQNWASTQNNLAIAYRDRIRGDRGENLELSIACYEGALEVYTKQDLPREWAMTQNNLANTYLNRIRGDRGENLELSIICYEAALEVYTKQVLPREWASTQNNLATAYRDRIRGDRGENLELSIAYYKAALEVHTKKDLPRDWAMTQNNLAIAYSDRIRGDRGENLELSIACYEAALEVLTKKDLPREWAITQNNLGEAYILRLQLFGVKEADHTIELLQELTLFFLEQQRWRNASSSYTLWAKALIDKNNTNPNYSAAVVPLIKAINLDQQYNPDLIDTSIEELATILPHLNWQPPDLPKAWQSAIHNEVEADFLAKLYFNIGLIDRSTGRWQTALDYFNAAWQIYQKSDNLQDFAEINYQLANTHHLLSNLSKAGMYYRDALRLYQHLENQRRVAFCNHGLGRLLFQLGEVSQSIATLQQAISGYQQLPPGETIASQIAEAQYYLREIGTIYPNSLANLGA